MIIASLEQAFSKAKNPTIAQQQAAYMKHLFMFLGLPKPTRAALQKTIFSEHSITNAEDLKRIVRELWEKSEREFHYAAIDLALRHKKLWTHDFLALFEQMIRTHSWWDSVDAIAANMVGALVKKYPELVTKMDVWVTDHNLWIRRTALLFQLRWKKETDEQRLYKYCKALLHEKDFFIRKAIGWTLREYSKTHPTSVKAFIEEHKQLMSPLSIREGSKYL